MPKDNIAKDSFISFPLDFLLKDNFFLKKNFSEFLFKLGIFNSDIYKNYAIKLRNNLRKELFFIVPCLLTEC